MSRVICAVSTAFLALLVFSVFTGASMQQQAQALSAITFTTKTTITSSNPQFQQVYENGTNSVITLDATSGATYQKNVYNVAAGTIALSTFGVSGNGNTINSAAYTSPIDIANYSINYDGSNDCVKVNDSASLDLTTGMTYFARVKFASTSGVQDFMRKDNAYFLQLNGGKLAGGVWHSGSPTVYTGATTLNANTWYNIAITYNDAAISIYLNGNLDVSGAMSGNIDTTATDLYIGCLSGTGEFLNGKQDDTFLYSASKSQAQIQALSGGIMDTMGIVLRLQDNEGSGTSAYDQSGNNNNGVLQNGPTWSSDVQTNSFVTLSTFTAGRDTAAGKNGFARIDLRDNTKAGDIYITSSYPTRAIAQSISTLVGVEHDGVATNGALYLMRVARDFASNNEVGIYAGTSGNPAYGVLMDSSASDGSNIEMYGASTNWIAEKVTANSSLVGKKLDMITLYLQKTGAPPGSATIGVFNAAGTTTFTCATQTGAGLTTSEAAYTFMCGSTYTVQSGDYIGIKYTGGDGANKILISQTAADVFDGTNSVWSSSGAGPSWTDDNTKDLRGLFTDSANVKIAVIDGSPDKEYVFFESGTSSLAVVKYTNSATTITTALSHTAGKEYSIIQLSGKIIIQTDSATYSLNTSSDVITTLYSSTFLTRYPQSFTISPATRTYSSSGLMIANSTYAALAVPSTGTVTSTGILVSSTVDGSGTLVTYQPSSYYYLPQNTLVTEGPATTWTIKALGSSLQIAPNSYSEHLSVNLQSNSTLFSQDVFRLVCGTGSYHVIYSKYAIGDDSDCAAWRVLASSSVSVGREIFDPYSRTPDLVHTTPQTAYTFTLSATDPTVYTLKSLYNNKVVDVNIFDASGQSQQRYLYGQCYTIQVHNNNDGSIINPGQICANDATTKSLNLQTLNVPQNWTDAGWHYNVTRTFGTGNVTTSNIQFSVKYNPTPYTARVLTTDSYLTNYQTFHTWYNFTNVNATSTVAITKPNNSTIYFIVYDNHDIPRLTVASHGKAVNLSALTNAFAPIGNLFGIPLTAFFVVLGAAIFVKSNSPFGVIVVAALAGFMFATGLIPISAAAWGGIMVVAALGAIYAIKRF